VTRPARLALAALALAALLPAGGRGHSGPALAESPSAQAWSLVVERPGGARARLDFLVAARTPADAERAVAAALRALPVVPAAPGVSAAWRPWGWAWSDDELPVPVAYNPAGAPPVVGPQAVIAGLQAWSSVEGSRFAFRYAGITDRTASILDAGPDGENVISWVHLPCHRGCVLGLTSKEEVHEVDILLNSNPNALAELGLDTVLDWRTIILHELGHMAGLEHSCPAPWGPCTPDEVAAVMYFQYTGINRVLAPDDRAGIRARYPAEPPPVAVRRLALEPGWNLLVAPPIPPGALAARLPCLAAAYAFDGAAWLRWAPELPAPLRTLARFPPEAPVWLLASGPCAAEFPAP
jgi:hypothetical protein